MFKRRIFRQGHCEWCEKETQQQRRIPDHLIHGVLTMLTCGLWGVSWLSMVVVMKGERWRCMRCRAPQSEHPAQPAGVEPAESRVVLPGPAVPPLSVVRTERLEKVA